MGPQKIANIASRHIKTSKSERCCSVARWCRSCAQVVQSGAEWGRMVVVPPPTTWNIIGVQALELLALDMQIIHGPQSAIHSIHWPVAGAF